MRKIPGAATVYNRILGSFLPQASQFQLHGALESSNILFLNVKLVFFFKFEFGFNIGSFKGFD